MEAHFLGPMPNAVGVLLSLQHGPHPLLTCQPTPRSSSLCKLSFPLSTAYAAEPP